MGNKIYDKTGRQIFVGDVLKIYHFQAALRREHRYMYKYVEGYHENKKPSWSGICYQIQHRIISSLMVRSIQKSR